jgi:hypothetical protein
MPEWTASPVLPCFPQMEGPMNLGPKDQRLLVKRDTIEAVLVALQLSEAMPQDAQIRRRQAERARLARILRSGGE